MIRFLRNVSPEVLKGTAVVRLDFNTEDEWRMEAALPTLKFILSHGAKIVILSHRGRPKDAVIRANGRMAKFERKFSLGKDAKQLQEFLKRKVHFIPHFNFGEIRDLVRRAKAQSVFVLENLRFLKGEESNSRSLGRKLASLGSFYVNEAFAVSHRDDASVVAITRFLPSYAGLELQDELAHLSRAMKRPRRPLVMVFGGGKAHDKLKVVRYFKNRADSFIFGGTPANTILKIRGLHVGDSVYDRNPGMTIHEIIKHKNILLPIDYVVKKKIIMDVGQKTVKYFSKAIRGARTVIWNGPLGMIENAQFRKGTLGLAKAIAANRKAFTLAGGGETVMFLKKYHLDKKFSFISTGGGAMLEYLAGEKLSGIEALKTRT